MVVGGQVYSDAAVSPSADGNSICAGCDAVAVVAADEVGVGPWLQTQSADAIGIQIQRLINVSAQRDITARTSREPYPARGADYKLIVGGGLDITHCGITPYKGPIMAGQSLSAGGEAVVTAGCVVNSSEHHGIVATGRVTLPPANDGNIAAGGVATTPANCGNAAAGRVIKTSANCRRTGSTTTGFVPVTSAHGTIICGDAVRIFCTCPGISPAADGSSVYTGCDAVAAVTADEVRAGAVRLQTQSAGVVDVQLQGLVISGTQKVGAWGSSCCLPQSLRWLWY